MNDADLRRNQRSPTHNPMMTPPASRNRLQTETSPYLLQHADNPVDWYPWDEEALSKAKSEDKPILLSIGYSACHWCHVMAHESFEDAETAAVMNELFVNIKVDREERPDLDKIYQLAHQLLTRRAGGWPLTVFLDPHQRLPFFAGTYFPSQPRFNLPGFVSVLRRVASYYRERPDDLKANQQALRSVLEGLDAESSVVDVIDEQVLLRAEDALIANFDSVNGGFGQAPKFPHTSDLAFLQRRGSLARPVTERNLQIVEKTLTAMAHGGIYDQLGGGFFRYSVDAHWGIPHFEKMLYDNGPLLSLYSGVWLATGNPLFRHVAEETADWVLREMQAEDGAFFSSLDADSEGVEGKYYAWDRREVAAVLPEMEARALKAAFGMEDTPNFEHHWHLHRARSDEELAHQFALTPEQVDELLTKSRRTLLGHRNQRVRPGRDEKVLVAWNALMIKGLACAGRILQRADLIAAAFRAFDFLRVHCWCNGRLRAGWKDGKAPLNAYLDDHVMLIDAALALLRAEWRTDALEWAIVLADQTLNYFEDSAGGGFFFTSADHEKLIHRPKPLLDESLPSGNGVAASALLRLGRLLGNLKYTGAAERTLKSAAPAVSRYPAAHASLLQAIQEWLYPPHLVILRGQREALTPWLQGIARFPNCIAFAIPDTAHDLPGDLSQRQPLGQAVAHVCSGSSCLPPIETIAELQAELAAQ